MTQRISLIDALRGFSLLGILIANLLVSFLFKTNKFYLTNTET